MKSIIGIPKEIKLQEYRVAVTPTGVQELIKSGHTVYIETNAGLGSGYDDKKYLNAGARIVENAEEVFQLAQLIVKVKEPQASEYKFITEKHTIFTYFHFASSKSLTDAMIASGSNCIAYETVTASDGSLPLLIPMSQVAGRLASQLSAHYLLKPNLGKGKLMGGIPGTPPANVMILGGGIVGMEAARVAAGMGANVSILDINPSRLNYLSNHLPSNVTTLFSNAENIQQQLHNIDIIIGAVLIPGGKAPKLITNAMLADIPKGSVLLDVAVDQGGCIESVSPTTHEQPIKLINDVVHYGVPNMPGAVPMTSTQALANTTLSHLLQLAYKGYKVACSENIHLKNGLNIEKGHITHERLKLDFDIM